MSEEKKEITKDTHGYVIAYQKQTSMLGEFVTINTWMPKETTMEGLGAELTKIGDALHYRMLAMNQFIKKASPSGMDLDELGERAGQPIGTGVFSKEDA